MEKYLDCPFCNKTFLITHDTFREYNPSFESINWESPKASATLSRRCIQGMIRDRWEVKESTLFHEIDAIKDKIDPRTWAAINSVRQIGNIGAHMEKDIDLIVEIDP